MLFMDNLYTTYKNCIATIISPAVFAKFVQTFVDKFIEEEMSSTLEQCNYWSSCLKPVARKKTALVLDLLRQFHVDMNNNYKRNGIPLVSTEEAVMVAKAITRRINKVCGDKRNYRTSEKKCVLKGAYNFNNQLDFYLPNGKADDKLLGDSFVAAYTEMEDIRFDLKCQRFLEKADNLKGMDRSQEGIAVPKTTMGDKVLGAFFKKWKEEDMQIEHEDAEDYQTPSWVTEGRREAYRKKRWEDILNIWKTPVTKKQLNMCLAAMRESEENRKETAKAMRRKPATQGKRSTKENPKVAEKSEKKKSPRRNLGHSAVLNDAEEEEYQGDEDEAVQGNVMSCSEGSNDKESNRPMRLQRHTTPRNYRVETDSEHGDKSGAVDQHLQQVNQRNPSGDVPDGQVDTRHGSQKRVRRKSITSTSRGRLLSTDSEEETERRKRQPERSKRRRDVLEMSPEQVEMASESDG